MEGRAAISSTGNLLVEVISEGPHCVPCEYCIAAVEHVAADFPGRLEVRVVETKREADAERYLELCRSHGKNLPMPSVLIQGRLAFQGIPEAGELRERLNAALDE